MRKHTNRLKRKYKAERLEREFACLQSERLMLVVSRCATEVRSCTLKMVKGLKGWPQAFFLTAEDELQCVTQEVGCRGLLILRPGIKNKKDSGMPIYKRRYQQLGFGGKKKNAKGSYRWK